MLRLTPQQPVGVPHRIGSPIWLTTGKRPNPGILPARKPKGRPGKIMNELTDSQWQVIEKIIDDQRWHPLRTMVNAILSINRTGAQWRELDSKYPPWQSVYYHFRQFKLRGIWPGRHRGTVT